MSSGPTLVIELTPPGRAAVAVVLVAGPDAVSAVAQCFTPQNARPICDIPPGRVVFGHWGLPPGEEVIVCRRAEHKIEIHCHGGDAAVRAVMNRLLESGCTQVSWQQWLQRSSFNRLACAAQLALSEAPTACTAAVLLDQFHGALTTRVRSAMDAVEANDWKAAQQIIESILQFREVGLHLTTPWRVVLAGAPNVGKSSLLNAMAGYRRAIVSPLPGTTRDVVTLTTAIDGWPVQLADTAGLRPGGDELESAGISLAQSTLSQADLVIAVHDATIGFDSQLMHFKQTDGTDRTLLPQRVIHVFNKIDLLVSASQSSDLPPGVIPTSALTGEGIAHLLACIGSALVPISPSPGAAVPFTPALVEGLQLARTAISNRDTTAASAALMDVIA